MEIKCRDRRVWICLYVFVISPREFAWSVGCVNFGLAEGSWSVVDGLHAQVTLSSERSAPHSGLNVREELQAGGDTVVALDFFDGGKTFGPSVQVISPVES